MRLSLRKMYSRIGLDLGKRQIKAVQIARRGKAISMVAAAVINRKEGASLDDDLDRLMLALERQGFVGREVVVACPPEWVHTDILEVPPQSSGAPIDQIARVEMQRMSKFEGSFEMTFWELPSTTRTAATSSVMATAVSHSDSQPLLDRLTAHGLDVASVETHATALASLFAGVPEDQITAIVDTGASASALILVNAGTVIYQRRSSEISFDLLRRTLAAELELGEPEQDYLLTEIGVMDAEGEKRQVIAQESRLRSVLAQHLDALSDEIEASLSYAAHRYTQLRASQVVLIGGGAFIKGIERFLGQRLSVDVSVARPAAFLSFSPDQADRAVLPTMMSALGLAMNEAE